MGAVWFEALTGRRLLEDASYHAVMAKLLAGDAPELRPHIDALPSGVRDALERALRVDRAQRHPSMDAFARALLDDATVASEPWLLALSSAHTFPLQPAAPVEPLAPASPITLDLPPPSPATPPATPADTLAAHETPTEPPRPDRSAPSAPTPATPTSPAVATTRARWPTLAFVGLTVALLGAWFTRAPQPARPAAQSTPSAADHARALAPSPSVAPPVTRLELAPTNPVVAPAAMPPLADASVAATPRRVVLVASRPATPVVTPPSRPVVPVTTPAVAAPTPVTPPASPAVTPAPRPPWTPLAIGAFAGAGVLLVGGSVALILQQSATNDYNAQCDAGDARGTCGDLRDRAVATQTLGWTTLPLGALLALRLTDPYVSRYHVEVEGDDDGVVIRDLGSRNGTRAGALTVREVTSRTEVELELGRSKLRVIPGDGRVEVPLRVAASFGSLVGASRPMREVYATRARDALDRPGAHHRRVGHGQGARGALPPRGLGAREGPLRSHRLRRDATDAHRGRALRLRARGLHRRARRARGRLRTRRQGDGLSRRARRAPAGASTAAPPRARRGRGATHRRHALAQGRRARRRGHQP